MIYPDFEETAEASPADLELSAKPCGICGGQMLAWEEKTAGLCETCYWTAHGLTSVPDDVKLEV